MCACALDAQGASRVVRAARGRDFDPFHAVEILAGNRGRIAEHLFDGPFGNHLAAVLSGAGSEIDEVIGGTDGFLVVLHDEHGIAHVAQSRERGEQSRVVALVQPDARLVENVEHANEPRPDLGGEADALGFASRERLRAPAECEVIEADVDEEAKPFADLLENRTSDVGIESRLARCA